MSRHKQKKRQERKEKARRLRYYSRTNRLSRPTLLGGLFPPVVSGPDDATVLLGLVLLATRLGRR